MSLDPKEAIELVPRAADLITQLRTALDAAGDGGRRITRAEARAILTAAAALIGQLVVEALD